jgi:AcrR family transcriptional regulator
MDKKEIQEQRIRGYFIEATREMLKGEGLRSINVRAVAERAGYSYATLYNYFKDIKELVFICVKGFEEEAEILIDSETADAQRGKEKIKAILKSYIRYFVQYPGIFELFFVEKMNDIGASQPTASLIYTFPDRLCDNEWQFLAEQNQVNQERASVLKNQLKFAVTGMMLFFIHRGQPAGFNEFNSMVDEQLNSILYSSPADSDLQAKT